MGESINGSYTVQKGDNLRKVAKQVLKQAGNNKPTSAQIKEAMDKLAKDNNLEKKGKLQEGQSVDISYFKDLPSDETLIEYIGKNPIPKPGITYSPNEGNGDNTGKEISETDKKALLEAFKQGIKDGTIVTKGVGEAGEQLTVAGGEGGGAMTKSGMEIGETSLTLAIGEGGGDMTKSGMEIGETSLTLAIGEGGGAMTKSGMEIGEASPTLALGEGGGDNTGNEISETDKKALLEAFKQGIKDGTIVTKGIGETGGPGIS